MKLYFDKTLPRIKYYKENDWHFYFIPSVEIDKFINIYSINFHWLFFSFYIETNDE
jgi:hypothetical protein